MVSGNLIGITLATIASISGATGNLLFRLSWKSEEYRRCIRFSGLLTVLAADPARIGSFGFGDPSVVAPFSALSLVWLLLLANPIAGDKPTRIEVISALVIACGVVFIAAFGSSSEEDEDDQFSIDDGMDADHELQAVIRTFRENAQRGSFIVYMVGQALFLAGATFVICNKPTDTIGPKICWGAMGGVLQGNVYFLSTASKMAVLSFWKAWTYWQFIFFTISFIIIASTGLLINALAMRYYKATFCVSSFVGWYNVSAAISAASFFGSDLHGTGLALYLTGMVLIVGGVVALIVNAFDDVIKEEEPSEAHSTQLLSEGYAPLDSDNDNDRDNTSLNDGGSKGRTTSAQTLASPRSSSFHRVASLERLSFRV